MLTWEELDQAAPKIAANGRELIERFQFVLVGTLTDDGSPRVTRVEAYILDGHPDSDYFEFFAERAALVTYDEGQHSIRWPRRRGRRKAPVQARNLT